MSASRDERDLGQAVGAGLVVGARHRHLGSEAAAGVGDARVLGGDDHALQALGLRVRLPRRAAPCGTPAIGASGLPGKRVACHRAGITPTAVMAAILQDG